MQLARWNDELTLVDGTVVNQLQLGPYRRGMERLVANQYQVLAFLGFSGIHASIPAHQNCQV